MCLHTYDYTYSYMYMGHLYIECNFWSRKYTNAHTLTGFFFFQKKKPHVSYAHEHTLLKIHEGSTLWMKDICLIVDIPK